MWKEVNVCMVDVGQVFRWRANRHNVWEYYTIVGWDEQREVPMARCSHGNVNQFNPCATVEVAVS